VHGRANAHISGVDVGGAQHADGEFGGRHACTAMYTYTVQLTTSTDKHLLLFARVYNSASSSRVCRAIYLLP
jgi:hypothetical protein